LNSRYPALRSALHSSRTKGVDAVIRHLANGMIAQTVWLQLVMAAVTNIRTDEEEGLAAEPDVAWQKAVLRRFLPRVFVDTTTPEERAKRAAEAIRDPNAALALISMVGSAVQEQIKAFRLVEHAERAGEEATSSRS
jgi:hypothetical protein